MRLVLFLLAAGVVVAALFTLNASDVRQSSYYADGPVLETAPMRYSND